MIQFSRFHLFYACSDCGGVRLPCASLRMLDSRADYVPCPTLRRCLP